MRAATALLATALAAIGWMGCGAFGTEGDRADLAEAGPDATGVPDGTGLDGDVPGARVDGGACPEGRGPSMLLVDGKLCIDTTEVTYAQYKAFLEARAGDAGGQPPECAWSTTFSPNAGWPYPAGKDAFRVPDVTWCAARAFCEWAGKRLCGTPGTGAPVAPSARAIASADEWYAACSQGAARAYPYGNTYAKEACNTGSDAGPTPVGSHPSCAGGYPGLLDMSGNVEEWDNACDSTTTVAPLGTSDACYVRGGTSNAVEATSTCGYAGRLFRGNHAGIRCCATPRP
jgi:formylglycine-generating enzyme required for sulfatase activity